MIAAGPIAALSGMAAEDGPAILERQTQELLDAVS
jgi:hypothetical protein